MHPADASALGVAEGDMVTLRNARGELTAKASLTEAVQEKSVFVPLYYNGGAVAQLFDGDSAVAEVEVIAQSR